MKNFVTAKWLIENINDEDLIILDATATLNDPLEGERSYKESHIKGAHFVSLEDISTGEIGENGGRHPMPELKKFVEDMQAVGVNDNSKVVIYDDGSIAMAGRLWFIFKLIGKEDVYILEEGKKGFIEKGGQVTEEAAVVDKKGDLTLSHDKGKMVDMQYVKDSIGKRDTAIVDVRAHKRYMGETEPLDSVAGHIEGALNYPWTDLVDAGEAIDLEKAEEKLKDLKNYKEIIVHCGSGITGTVAVLLLDEMGVDSKLYAGGYSDWVSYKDNKVVQGED